MKINYKKTYKVVNKYINSKEFAYGATLISFLGIIFSMYVLLIGFHNFDNCQNVKRMEYEINQIMISYNLNERVSLNEIKTNGETWTTDACYIDGVGKVLNSVFPLILSSISFGVLLCKNYFQTNRSIWRKK